MPESERLTRLAKAALLACGVLLPIGMFSPGLVLPQMARDFGHLPNAALLAQLVGAITSFTFAIGSPLAGALIVRVGCRPAVVTALVLFGLIGAAPAWLDDLWAILIMRALLGLVLATVFTAALTGIGRLPDAGRAQMFGWFAMVGGVAGIVVFPTVGALARQDWHFAFLVHLVALLVLPLALQLPAGLGRHARTQPAADGRRSDAARLLSPAMLGLLALAAFAGMAMFIPSMYAPLYLASIGITDPRLLAIPVTLGSGTAVLASAGYGVLHRRLGVQGVSGAMMAIMGLALLTAGSVGSFASFTMALLLHSATLAVMAPNVNASALAFSPPAKAAQAMGLASGTMFGAPLVLPFIASGIRHVAGLAAEFLAFGAVALAIALVIFVRLGWERHRATPGAR